MIKIQELENTKNQKIKEIEEEYQKKISVEKKNFKRVLKNQENLENLITFCKEFQLLENIYEIEQFKEKLTENFEEENFFKCLQEFKHYSLELVQFLYHNYRNIPTDEWQKIKQSSDELNNVINILDCSNKIVKSHYLVPIQSKIIILQQLSSFNIDEINNIFESINDYSIYAQKFAEFLKKESFEFEDSILWKPIIALYNEKLVLSNIKEIFVDILFDTFQLKFNSIYLTEIQIILTYQFIHEFLPAFEKRLDC